jgi:hypothetical protein
MKAYHVVGIVVLFLVVDLSFLQGCDHHEEIHEANYDDKTVIESHAVHRRNRRDQNTVRDLYDDNYSTINFESYSAYISNITILPSKINWDEDDSPFRIGAYEWTSLREYKLNHGRCAMRDQTDIEKQESDRIVLEWEEKQQQSHDDRSGGLRRSLQTTTIINVPVYWWCITSGSSGSCSTTAIDTQITVLNAAYRPAGISFSLVSSQSVNRPEYYNCAVGSTTQTQFKNEFRRGGAESLNIYTCNTAGGVLGWSTFPYSGSGTDKDDGVVLRTGTLPGGTDSPYNLGATAVHEIGHWFGLSHTFQGGCTSPGDSISDTAPEARPAYGCRIGRDTCSGGGTDPVTNFMDYSDDSCLTGFSTRQNQRMVALWNQYRAPVASAPAPAPSASSTRIVRVVVSHDNYPEDTGWTLTTGSTTTLSQQAGSIKTQAQVVTRTATLSPGQYTFQITDSFGDGLCCTYGSGSYAVTVGGIQVASGSRFSYSEATSFTVA